MVAKESHRDLIALLERFISETEEAYLELGTLYPKVMREMESSFSSKAGGFSQDAAKARSLVAGGKGIFDDAKEKFEGIARSDAVLIERLQEGLAELSSLEGYIAKIRDDTSEMELVSLNALTVALKSGSAGKAFSVITEELKRLSARTIQMTEDLTVRGAALSGQFAIFSQSIEELESKVGELFAELSRSFVAYYDELSRGVLAFADGFERLSAKADGLRKPIGDLMVEIQLHDIIRQSTEHVAMALKELDSSQGLGEAEEAAFLSLVMDLSSKLIDEIAQKIERSIRIFSSCIGDVLSIAAEGEADRKRFAADGALGGGFEERLKGERELIAKLVDSAASKRDLSERGRLLLDGIGTLAESFKAFVKVSNRFRTIDIASRIEVAKQRVLLTMNDTVNAMSRLTQRIDEDVQGAVARTKDMIEGARGLIEGIATEFALQERAIIAMARSLTATIDSLGEAERGIASSIHEARIFSEAFVELIKDLGKAVEGLGALAERLRGIGASVEGIKAQADSKLASMGLRASESEVTSERLRAVIERFTILTHKRKAGELGGFEVEDGVEDGAVTLF
jgi:hypothetical protein